MASNGRECMRIYDMQIRFNETAEQAFGCINVNYLFSFLQIQLVSIKPAEFDINRHFRSNSVFAFYIVRVSKM